MRESPESIERRRKEVTLELETKGHVFFFSYQRVERRIRRMAGLSNMGRFSSGVHGMPSRFNATVAQEL